MEQDKPANGTIEAMPSAVAAVLARDPKSLRAAVAEREAREAKFREQLEALRPKPAEVKPEPERELTIAEQVEAGVRAALGTGDRPMTQAEIRASLAAKTRQMLQTEEQG